MVYPISLPNVERQRRNLTAITNFLPVINILAGLPEISVVVHEKGIQVIIA